MSTTLPLLAVALALGQWSVPEADSARWRARLVPPRLDLDELALLRFEPEELERPERVDPALRARELGEQVAAGEPDPRLRAELAGLLAAQGQRAEAHALFAELAAEIAPRLESESGNWGLAGLYGELLVAYGEAFRDLESYSQGEALLRQAFEAEPSLWQAAERLARLHLEQSLAQKRASEPEAAARALELALSYGARAVESAPARFRAWRTRFTVRWASVAEGGTLDSALDAVEILRRGARVAPDPEWTGAMADALECSLLFGTCPPASDPASAFEGLPAELRGRPKALTEGLAVLATHPRWSEAGLRLLWLQALWAAAPDEPERFAAALEKAPRPELLLEGRLLLLARRLTQEEQGRLAAELLERREDARSHELLAAVQLERGDPVAAAAHYRRALVLEPGAERARIGLAVALIQESGPQAEALALLEPFASREDAPAAALFALGTARALAGDRAGARELLRRAASKAPLEQRALVLATAAELGADDQGR